MVDGYRQRFVRLEDEGPVVLFEPTEIGKLDAVSTRSLVDLAEHGREELFGLCVRDLKLFGKERVDGGRHTESGKPEKRSVTGPG